MRHHRPRSGPRPAAVPALRPARLGPEPAAAVQLAVRACAPPVPQGAPGASTSSAASTQRCRTVDVPWFDDQRQALLRERLAAELAHVDLRLRAGHHGDLLSELTVKAREHLLDERLAGQLMLALYRSGRASDALAHYQDLRRRLAEELGAEPGPHLLGLHRQILANDPALSPPEEASRAPAAGAPPAVPRQLLAPPAHFVGREAELAVLDQTLAGRAGPRATLPLTVVCGIGGVGKTSLALQLFVDLHGFTPSGEPADPRVVLRGFLDALGVDPGRIPAAFDAQAALYRSLLASRRVLVVLDNALDSAQVLPLLPGSPACVVLVTSRDRMMADRAGPPGPEHVTDPGRLSWGEPCEEP